MFKINGTFIDCCSELRGVLPIFNEINLPKYIPSKEDTLGSLAIGGLIHKEVRRRIRPLLKPGTSLLHLTQAIEKETIELAKPYNTINNGIGFPCGISVNECAAHWAPSSNTNIVINKDDVIKIDYGVEINGWIIDSAFTITFNPKYDNLLTAVQEATMHGIKTAGVGVDIHDWSRGVGEIMESYDINLDEKNHKIQVIETLGGHNILNGIIHGGIFLPGKDLGNKLPYNYKFTEGIYAIETFGSTGINKTTEIGKSTLFRINPNYSNNNISNPKINSFYKKIYSSFKTLPFCNRYVELFDSDYEKNLDFLVDNKWIHSYPPLHINKGEYSAQYEHTIMLVDGKKPIVFSQGEDY
jgi:methionyl aminopeptidase